MGPQGREQAAPGRAGPDLLADRFEAGLSVRGAALCFRVFFMHHPVNFCLKCNFFAHLFFASGDHGACLQGLSKKDI